MSLKINTNFASDLDSSNHLLVIKLKETSLGEIVDKKLRFSLKENKIQKNLLKEFYNPVEKALIKNTLKNLRGNQVKTAKALGINRNTLKKKILDYGICIKSLLENTQVFPQGNREVFVGKVFSLDLCKVSSDKLNFIHSSTKEIPLSNLIDHFCKSVEKIIIENTLIFYNNNQVKTAKALGINRNTLKKKLDYHKIAIDKIKRDK